MKSDLFYVHRLLQEADGRMGEGDCPLGLILMSERDPQDPPEVFKAYGDYLVILTL